MSENNQKNIYFEELRQKAENILNTGRRETPSIEDMQELIHELQVHQVELRMQNDELCKTQEALYEIKNEYQELFNSAPIGYFVLDKEAKCLEVNQKGFELLGNPVKPIVNVSLNKFMYSSSLVILNDHFNQLFSTGEPQEFEVQIRVRGGRYRWVHLCCKFLKQSGGPSVPRRERILAAMVDITEKKEREQQLAKSRQEYSDIIETADSIIVKIDMEGKITFMNRFGFEFYGFTREDIIGKPAADTIAPELDTEEIDGMSGLESFRQFVSKNLKAGGSRASVQWRIKTIQNEYGNNAGILMLGHDITELKKAEKIIKRDNKKLELLVEERTEQLMKAQKKIEESKRLTDLGRLAATVAHELRMPFASLKLSIYNARKKRTNSEIDTHLDRCDEKIFEGEQIINNLLKSSSLNEPEFQEIDLGKILTESLNEVQKHYKGRHVRLEKKLEPLNAETLKADPLQIKEVVYNILQNSYEALFSEEGTIKIKGFIDDETAGFSVTDNDKGIPKEEIDKITEPFYTTKHRGVGLGLTIAKEIINGHGGSLEIKSEDGAGTTVTVTLPKDRPPPDENQEGGLNRGDTK